MFNYSYRNRTLWHSGLLFILLVMVKVSKAKIEIAIGDSGALRNGAWVQIDSEQSVVAMCQSTESQFEEIQWTLNGKIISNQNVISDRESVTLDQSLLSENQNKLECFVSNNDDYQTSSYAFVYLGKEGSDLTVSSGTLTLSVIEGEKFMSQGARVTLQCKLSVGEESSDLPFPVFHWMRNAKPLNLATSKNFDVKVISGVEQHLVFDDISVSDGGNYGCKTDGAFQFYEETNLVVVAPPSLKLEGETIISARATASVEISCQVLSSFPPVDKISWTKDNHPFSCENVKCSFEQNNVGAKISFSSLTPSDAGEYSCSALNAAGVSIVSRSLQVTHEPPTIIQISVKGGKFIQVSESKFLLLQDSEGITLDCQGAGWPNPSISFSHAGLSHPNPTNIDRATEEAIGGSWTCLAENEYGESALKAVEVLVVPPIQFGGDVDESVLAHIGENVNLNCDYIVDQHLLESAKVTWTHNGNLIEGELSNVLARDGSKPELVSGEYECRVATSLHSATKKWTVSIVQKPVIVHTFPAKLVRLVGMPLKVPCFASGIPDPKIEWRPTTADELNETSSNRLIVDTPDDLKPVDLDFVTFTSETAGYYKCVAGNDHGQSELGILIVSALPTQPAHDFQNESTITGRAGDVMEIGCSVIVDPVLAEVAPISRTWEKDGKMLDDIGEKLVIPYLVGHEHSGIYTCTVETAADKLVLVQKLKVVTAAPVIEKFQGNSKSNSSKKSADYFVVRGNDLTLTCDVIRGIPTPQISWKRILENSEETIQYQTSSTFSFIDTDTKDEGEYGCLAVNEYGSDLKTFRLLVLKPTTLPSRQEETLAETFDDVRFQCQPDVDQRITSRITWFSPDGNAIESAQGSELLLRKVTKSLDGDYVCFAETDYDSANSTFKLAVSGEVPAFISTEKDVRVLEGNNVTVSCQANGLPLPKISWFKDGSPLKDRRFFVGTLGDLTLTSLTLADAGEFVCKAENVYGVAQTMSNVEVLRRADTGSRESGNSVVKNVGENVSLVCDVTFDARLRSETKVRWFFKREEKGSMVTPVFDSSKFTTKKLKPKFEIKDNYLKIADLKVEDKGVYECLVDTPFEKVSYSVNLFVNGEAPKILSDLKKQTIYEGQTLELACLVRGSPRPTLRWFFNDRPLPAHLFEEVETASPTEFRESRVKIAAISKKDDGVYQCETSNLYGSGVAKFAKVSVIGRTTVRIGSGGADPEKELVVHAGEKLKIPCRVDNDPGNRITNITWEKDDHPISVTSEDRIDFGMDGSVTIANVQKRHSGIYRCTATTTLDSANDTVPLRVVVNAPVITSRSPARQIVFDGDSLALLCNANGIPEPKISWVFNKTRTNIIGSEYRINNAINSDTGEYICEAKNEYGETRHAMEVEVFLLPHFPAEMYVDKGSIAKLSCVTEMRDDIEISWQKDYKDIVANLNENLTVFPNGTLIIENVSDNSTGAYMCTVTSKLSPSRRRLLQTGVRLRPVIITSQGSVVNVVEGLDTALSCQVVPGLEAKRLWRFNGDFFAHDARRDLKRRGERLEIRGAKLSDAGNYSCVAISPSGERDTVHYDLRVIPKPTPVYIPSKKEDNNNTTTTECSSQPLTVTNIYRLDNATVQVEWSENGLDRSCYLSASVVWWTNVSDPSAGTSEYSEKSVPLSDTKATIGVGIPTDFPITVYYVQVNLVAPLNVQVYGETRSFVPADLDPLPERTLANPDSETDPLLLRAGSPAITVVVVALVVVVLIAAAFTIALFIYRRKYSKNPEPLETMCLWSREYCSCLRVGNSSRASQNSSRYGKTNFNGFDRGAFDGAIIISSPMSVVGPGIPEEDLDEDEDYDYDGGKPNLNRHSRFSVYRGSAYLGVNKNGANFAQSTSDFMSNLAPQWPEPEEPVSASLANIHHTTGPLNEREPFLAPKRHRHMSPSKGGSSRKRRSQSKESISSSWSSLFNVPAVLPSTPPDGDMVAAPFASSSVAIRPNNLSTSPTIVNNSCEPPPQVTSFMNSNKNRIV